MPTESDRLAGSPPSPVPADLRIASEPPAGPLAAARAGYRGQLPPRYATDTWDRRFRSELGQALAEDIDLLDVGAGARPVLAPDERPRGCTYVGLDVSAAELAKAPPGSYDRTVVADVTELEPDLRGQFDLVLSWMVLEHVSSLPAALENLRAYLRPGGRLIAQMPGAFSLAALANRVVPGALARRFLARTQGRQAGEVFPAHYDKCWSSALGRALAPAWERWEVRPLFSGVFYVAFSPVLRGAYLGYEEWAHRRDRRNLAPYYLITATAPG